jgi:hypothetical protein
MKHSCFPPFVEEQWLETAEGFEEQLHLPNCTEATNDKHIRIANQLTVALCITITSIFPYFSGCM